MSSPEFFSRRGPFSLAELARAVDLSIAEGGNADILLHGVAPLDQAGPAELAFLDNPQYVKQFSQTKAGVCIVSPRFAAKAPAGVSILISNEPYRTFARIAAMFFPEACRGVAAWGDSGVAAGSHIHAQARLEAGVTVEPGAIIGAGAEIGSGSVIAAGAVVGREVRIGRNCDIGAGASILHALVGNRVIIHPGVRIGQDGFGFAMGREGHLKVPQVGRVIIQDDVEIGANTTIDRGATRDTIIGEGSKIDNLVQIGHNVVIGRHCVIVAQTGISGSCEIGDFVAIGGQAGLVGHLKVGMGAQIAASSRVKDDVPAGARWGGTPAKPVREWFREIEAVRRLGRDWGKDTDRDGDE